MSKRLLFISYEFPPKGGTQAQHAAKLALGLARVGWDVRVLTVTDPPTSMVDEALLAEVAPKLRILRAWSAEPTRVVQWLRSLRGPATPAATSAGPGARAYTSLPHWAIRFVQAFFIPDEKVGWTPWAVAAGRRAFAEEPFDVILATGPSYTGYRVGRKLSRALRVPWVADLRDPIVGSYFFTPQTPVHAWLRAHFEATIVQDASRVLAATPGITEGVLQRVPDVADKFVDVANAFDPADFSGPAAPAHEGMVISYVGAFQVSINPRVFLAALRDASDADAGFAGDVCARFVGPIDPDTEAAVAGLGLETVVERTGFVSHAEAVAAMRSSDVLLFVLGRDEGLKLATGSKLPEYLGARRTVLALVPDDGIAADIVRRSGAGPVVPPDDVAAVSDALLDLHRRWLAGDLPHPSEDVVAGFDRDAIVRRLDTLLEAVAKEGRRG